MIFSPTGKSTYKTLNLWHDTYLHTADPVSFPYVQSGKILTVNNHPSPIRPDHSG